MAPPILATLETGIPTQSASNPDQQLSVYESHLSLKKLTCLLPAPKHLETPQDSITSSDQLTVQGFLHGLWKPIIPRYKIPSAPGAPKLQIIASIGLEDLPSIDSAAALGPGLLDLPESSPNEIDDEQVLSPSPESKRLRFSNPKGADEKDVSLMIPKVIRTYTKKAKPVSPVWKNSSARSTTQTFTHERVVPDGILYDGSDTRREQDHFKGVPKTRPARKHTSEYPQKRERQTLHDHGESRREDHGGDDANLLTRKKKRETKKTKRGASVDELTVVRKLPSDEDYPMEAQVRTSLRQRLI